MGGQSAACFCGGVEGVGLFLSRGDTLQALKLAALSQQIVHVWIPRPLAVKSRRGYVPLRVHDGDGVGVVINVVLVYAVLGFGVVC